MVSLPKSKQDMERPHALTTQKSYRRVNIPKEKHRIHGMIPAIRDAACELYEICTCTPKIRGEVRPATGADEEFFTALADLFRCYRWLAGTADPEDEKDIEDYASTTIRLLQKGLDVVDRIIPLVELYAAHPWIRVSVRDALACGIQTLVNCFGLSRKAQSEVWLEFCEVIGFIFVLDRSCILLQEDKLLNYVSAALLNCLKDDDSRILPIVDCGFAVAIFERVAQLTTRDDLIETFEAVFDLAAKLLRCPVIVDRDFDRVSFAARCAIVDLLSFAFSLNDRKDGLTQLLPPFWAEKMSVVFRLHWIALLRLKDPSPIADQEAELLLKALDLLGNVAAADSLRVIFHHDIELLDSVIDAFVAVDNLSRDGDNLFAPVNKLADVKPQELVTSARGIKSLLIRLLANLVYNNPKFIQHASERKLLQRLKDHTKIDYRNPYVQQWAILAIRNLHLTDAFDEVKREHAIIEVSEIPVTGRAVSQSVDGDLVGERRLTDIRNSPLKGRPAGRSDTVEALDLHTSFNEPTLLEPRHLSSSSRKKHQSSGSRKHRDVVSRTVKSDQGTQTVPSQSEEDKADDFDETLVKIDLDDDSVPSRGERPKSLATSSGKPRHQSR